MPFSNKLVFCVGKNDTIRGPSISGNSQGNYTLMKHALRSSQAVKPNYNNLNINLVTTLNLTGVKVIENNATGESPTTIELPSGASHAEFIADPADPTQFIETHLTTVHTDDYRYTMYTIDPSGQLFGDTECGLNNWKNKLVLDATL
jgi:hypothetical protein